MMKTSVKVEDLFDVQEWVFIVIRIGNPVFVFLIELKK